MKTPPNEHLPVCEESAVEMFVNGTNVVTFMCTPQELKDLALGHLLTRGIVSSMDEVYTMAACDDLQKIYVTTGTDVKQERYGLSRVLSSSCGSGSHFQEEFLAQEPNRSALRLPLARLKEHAQTMFRGAELYRVSGGVHCAVLANEEGVLALREDVGRHNAVDKVIGKGLFLGTDFQHCALVTTGRIATDMVLKAVAAGIPIVTTRSIPTSMALEVAERLGITLVGRIASKSPLIYAHGYRIAGGAEQVS